MAETRPYSFSELYIWGTARGQFWSLVVQALKAVNAFLVVAGLSVYHYGLYQLALAAVAFIDNFSSGLFDDIISNELSRDMAGGERSRAKRLFLEESAVKLFFGAATFAVLFFGAHFVAALYRPDIASYLRIMSFLMVLGAVSEIQGMFFRSTLSFSVFGASAIQELVRLAGIFAIWHWKMFTIAGVLWVSVASSAVIFLYAGYFFVRDYWRVFGGLPALRQWVFWGVVKKFGQWVFLRYAFSKAFKQMDPWVIRLFLNTEAVGLYALVINIVALIQNIFPLDMLSSLLPWEVGNERRFVYIYRRSIKYILWFGVVMAVGAAIAGPIFVKLFLSKYNRAMPFFRLMILTLPLYGIYKFQKVLLIVLREQRILTTRFFYEAGGTALIWLVTLPTIGLYGIVVEYFATYIGRVWLYFRALKKHYPHLALKLRHLTVFDQDDRVFFKRVGLELMHPERWLRPVRVRI